MPVIIDADILAYQIALECSEYTEFEDEVWVNWADAKLGKRMVDERIERIKETTNQDRAILCLSDTANFRMVFCETYKSNRAGKTPPMILKPLREYMLSELKALRWDGMEGDDVIGILATGEFKDDHVIFSLDKDLRTIPGTHWSDWRHSADEGCCITVTPEEARKTFFKQILTGDTVDGYKGCPGVGPVKADKMLSEDCSWQTIVTAYEKAGLTEEDALVQARLAFILHASHVDRGIITPWVPEEYYNER